MSSALGIAADAEVEELAGVAAEDDAEALTGGIIAADAVLLSSFVNAVAAEESRFDSNVEALSTLTEELSVLIPSRSLILDTAFSSTAIRCSNDGCALEDGD